jgi:regulator of protease activity HflC (stomatin/prohibitin superfamily)
MTVATLALLGADDIGMVVAILLTTVTLLAVAVAASSKQIKHDQEGYQMYYGTIQGAGGPVFRRSTASTAGSLRIHPIAWFWFIIFNLLGVSSMIFFAIRAERINENTQILYGLAVLIACIIISIIFITCLKVADQWDRVVLLRLGRFKEVQAAGAFWLMPFVDTIAKWIDTRVQSSDLMAEETLTKDTVPVDVDAVMFWLVYDPRKAALEVENFESAVTWAAQTALRDLIGKTMLADLLVGRDVLDRQLQEIIDQRTEPWGVTVQSVEIREIKIPQGLQDTMSRQAQAERERQARVILGESEEQIAQSFARAAEQYKNNPTALHLRAMNMLFEGLKEKGSLMIIPSSALDSMNMGAIGGLASIAQQHAASGGGDFGPPPAVV